MNAPLRLVPQSTRSLSLILAELLMARADRDRLLILAADDPSPEEDAVLTDLENRIWDIEVEAKAFIKATTGVDWDTIQGANL